MPSSTHPHPHTFFLIMECSISILQDKDRRLFLQKPSSLPLYSCDPASICCTYISGNKTFVGPLDEASLGASLHAFFLLSQEGFWMPPLSSVHDKRLDVYYLQHPTFDYLDTPYHSWCKKEDRLIRAIQRLPYRPLLPLSRLICMVRFGGVCGECVLTLRPCPWVGR